MTKQQNAVRTAKAFVPGHVTGIFRIFDEYEDPLRCGSTGAGFSVTIGTVTSVSVMERPSLEIITEYNNERIDAKVTKTVIQRLTEKYEKTLKVHVQHESSLLSGAGFGASGAGALGTALALSHLLDQDIEYTRAAEFAHIAEIVNQYEVERIVIGFPLTLNGQTSAAVKRVEWFIAALEARCGLAIEKVDERLTSVQAQRIVIEMGYSPSRSKGKIDQIAA
ncbi:MAG: Holliday junction resolvase RuvX, partial [Candidatus Thorarchaeota archaeon]